MTQIPPFDNVKRLLAFFQAHPNETFSADQIREQTGIPSGSLHGAFAVLVRGHKQAVKPSRGFYRWEQPVKGKIAAAPDASPDVKREPMLIQPPIPSVPIPPAAKLFELIGGPTSTGEYVLQSDSGDLFLARKL